MDVETPNSNEQEKVVPLDTNTQPETTPAPKSTDNAWLGYVVPFALFMIVTTLEGQFKDHYVWVYILKAVLVTAALIYFRKTWRDIKPDFKGFALGVVVGVAIIAQWILIDKYVPYPHMGERVGYNPFKEIPEDPKRLLFLAVRFYGLVLMVPLMEELFWRSFLHRLITDMDNFQRVAIHGFNWTALAVVAAGFALAHNEWLVALICGLMLGLLLKYSKSLFACFVAHLVANLILGIYVMTTQDWKYW